MMAKAVKSKARLGSFDDLMTEQSENIEAHVEPIARRLKEVVLAGFPDAVEVVRLGDAAASYGVGEKKMSEAHVYIMPKARYVNLGFYHGAGLPDLDGLLEGTGKKLRHVKVRSLEDADKPAVQALIAAALAERRSALGIEDET
ncbi:MAG: DUF1801 domain-containing protein [Chloroflexota bacterium]